MDKPGINSLIRRIIWLTLLVFGGHVLADSGSLGIELSPDSAQRFVFSNKISAFWYGESQAANLDGFEGYTIAEQRYLRDYILVLNGKKVERKSAERILLWPDRLERYYPEFKETLFFIDRWNAILVKTESNSPNDVQIVANFDKSLRISRWKWDKTAGLATTRLENLPAGRPEWAAIGGWSRNSNARIKWKTDVSDFSDAVSPSNKGIEIKMSRVAYFVLLFDSSQEELRRKFRQISEAPEIILNRRKNRVRRLLQDAFIQTPDSLLNKAYNWALISMDDLVTRQRGPGIWAGLPWFNNYWGRDSFISFRGALLASGQFQLGKEILRTFARFQNKDENSSDYGRIPNRVRIQEIIYNTVDGTPWFILASQQYLNYSGDTSFVPAIFPTARRAIEGAIRFRVDSLGFLTHGDADTWMDAVGNQGPWSPRGNRAVEIQILWMEQLGISARWARQVGENQLAEKWEMLAGKVRRNFKKFYWNTNTKKLYDHLLKNGAADQHFRPNAIFALTLPQKPLFSPREQSALLKEMFSRLIYPWGVATLPQDDPDFHPYHHFPPYYVPDAAYHNGLVWSWLNGPFISASVKFDPEAAVRLIRSEARQILQDNAVGSLAELKEAWPREGKELPRMSGAVSQAWSLAEFIRNVREDILGIHPDMESGRIKLTPRLPRKWRKVRFTAILGKEKIRGEYRKSKGNFSAKLTGKQVETSLSVEIQVSLDTAEVKIETAWTGAKPLRIEFIKSRNGIIGKVNGKQSSKLRILNAEPEVNFEFAHPQMQIKVPALAKPAYDLLTPGEVFRRPARGTRLLFDVSDALGDDKGPKKRYTYPTNVNFQPGILDGRRVKIWKDKNFYYFEVEYKNLVNPGWRPESGYQLTYTAITLNFSKYSGIRRSRVGMNAKYTVPSHYAYNFVIYVGNGLQIRNARGKIVADFVPVDGVRPLADLKTRRIRFSVPVRYLTELPLTNAFVLIGAQDDHGGGGIGEFRELQKTAGEWQGGGKNSGNAPNIYDTIPIRH